MKCPKCDHEQADANTICPHCGIVFEKYYKYHPRPGEEPRSPMETEVHTAREEESLLSLLKPQKPQENMLAFSGHLLVLIGLIIWSFSLIGSTIDSNAVGYSFLHMINLPFHEAGHVFFRPFGQFITSLGGTLGQLIMPAVACGVLLWKTRDPFGGAVCFWWFGENFLDIAPYINDARAGELPLVGGNFGHSSPYGFHDWEYLLTETGLLHLDHTIAKLSFALGSIIMILSLAWAGWLVWQGWLDLQSMKN